MQYCLEDREERGGRLCWYFLEGKKKGVRRTDRNRAKHMAVRLLNIHEPTRIRYLHLSAHVITIAQYRLSHYEISSSSASSVKLQPARSPQNITSQLETREQPGELILIFWIPPEQKNRNIFPGLEASRRLFRCESNFSMPNPTDVNRTLRIYTEWVIVRRARRVRGPVSLLYYQRNTPIYPTNLRKIKNPQVLGNLS